MCPKELSKDLAQPWLMFDNAVCSIPLPVNPLSHWSSAGIDCIGIPISVKS